MTRAPAFNAIKRARSVLMVTMPARGVSPAIYLDAASRSDLDDMLIALGARLTNLALLEHAILGMKCLKRDAKGHAA